jgi:hypothetical protein
VSPYCCCSGNKCCCLIPVPVWRKRECLYSDRLRIYYSCYGRCSSCRIRKGINRFGSWISFWITDDGESPQTEQTCDKLLLEHTPAAGLLHQHGWQKYQKRNNYNLRGDTASPLCFYSFNCIPSVMIRCWADFWVLLMNAVITGKEACILSLRKKFRMHLEKQTGGRRSLSLRVPLWKELSCGVLSFRLCCAESLIKCVV